MGRALLIIVAGFTVIFGTVKHNLDKANERATDLTIHAYETQVTQNTTASAANIAIANLRQDFTWRGAGYDSICFAGGNFSILVEDFEDDTSLAENEVRVTAVGRYSGLSDTIVVYLNKPSFSRYNIFSNKRPSNMYLITGDTLWGPMHTNTRWNISGSPVFYGKVTSVATDYQTYGETNPKFYGGTEFGIAPIDYPTPEYMEGYLLNAVNEGIGGDLYECGPYEEVWLAFHPDGSYYYKVYNKNTKQIVEEDIKYLSDINGMILVKDGDVHVQGTVSGKVTIATTKNIYIEDDLKYADDPRINSNSQDLIGLVALGKVWLVYNDANKNNCEIHGSIMALNKGIRAEYWNQYPPRGYLIILGGYIVEEEEPTGQFTLIGGKPVILHGYQKKYYYDQRLYYVAPPYFPIVQYAQIVSWWE
ncbi:MAG: DUF4900 domain-containing protein [candidate division KSB1 bacterium]|nr:DUF4900 domain-containing protein [candidate division KSB1 bacterium]